MYVLLACPMHTKMNDKNDKIMGGKIMNLFYLIKNIYTFQFFDHFSFSGLDIPYIMIFHNWNEPATLDGSYLRHVHVAIIF